MNELVYKTDDGKLVTNSKLIAGKFEKRHSDVLRAIENLECSQDFRERNFALLISNNLHPSPIIQEKEYIITRDGFSFLAMGFTGSIAAKFKEDFINEFNKMESLLQQDTLTHPTRKQLAQWVIEQEEKIEQLEVANKDKEKQLAIAAPKVLFAESVQTSKNSILIGDLAKIIKQNGYNIGRDRLFQWLRDNGYLLKFGNEYNKPSQMAMELGLFEIKETVIENPDKEPIISFTTKVTGKGQLYFINKFLRGKAA